MVAKKKAKIFSFFAQLFGIVRVISVLLCTFFTKLNGLMKKLATLFFAITLISSMSAFALTRHAISLRPVKDVMLSPQTFFLSAPGYIPQFSHDIQSINDSLSYIDSVTDPLRYAYIPGFINFIQSDQSRFPDTIITY